LYSVAEIVKAGEKIVSAKAKIAISLENGRFFAVFDLLGEMRIIPSVGQPWPTLNRRSAMGVVGLHFIHKKRRLNGSSRLFV